MTRIRYFILFCLIGLGMVPWVRAQQPVAANASVLDDPFIRMQGKAGLDALYNMEFAAADSIFEIIEKRYPGHPVGAFLHALTVWWQILPDLANTEHDAAFFDAMEDVIRRSDRLLKRDKEHFDAIFFKGAALGFRGRHRSNRRSWFAAARDGQAALGYVLDIAEADTSNADYIFGKGVYDYFAAVIPEKYPIVKPLMIFFPEGDRARGLRHLRHVAEEGLFIQTEAAYFLLQIYLIYEPNFAESRRYITWLRTQYPQNAYFHALEGLVHAMWRKWPDVQRIYSDVLEQYRAGAVGYTVGLAEQALYYLGRRAMIYSDLGAARQHLLALESLTSQGRPETYYRVYGHLRLGMVYDALGYREQARSQYRQVLRLGDRNEAHKRARQYLKAPYQQ